MSDRYMDDGCCLKAEAYSRLQCSVEIYSTECNNVKDVSSNADIKVKKTNV